MDAWKGGDCCCLHSFVFVLFAVIKQGKGNIVDEARCWYCG